MHIACLRLALCKLDAKGAHGDATVKKVKKKVKGMFIVEGALS